jgi:hypothetical protein
LVEEERKKVIITLSEDGNRKHPPKELIDKDNRKCLPKEIPVLVTGLIYSDDDDYIDKVDIYSEDKFWSSFPRDHTCQNLIVGGPQKLDTLYMTAAEEQAALEKKLDRKSCTDKQCVTKVKLLASVDFMSLPQKSQVGLFLGDQNTVIRMMAAVKSSRLEIDHSFQFKETLQICIGKEGNLRQIKLKTIRFDHVNFFIIAESNFYVYAAYLLQLGWEVQKACCQEGDDTRKIPHHLKYINDRALRSPFKSR